MLDIAVIGLVMLIVGTFLLIVFAWMQVRLRDGFLKDLAEAIFLVAGLLGIGGALVLWASLLRYVFQRLVIDPSQPLVYIFILVMTGVLTVVTYKPFLDLVRNWAHRNVQQTEVPVRKKLKY